MYHREEGLGLAREGPRGLGYSEERDLGGSRTPFNTYLLHAYYWPGTGGLASVQAATKLIFS